MVFRHCRGTTRSPVVGLRLDPLSSVEDPFTGSRSIPIPGAGRRDRLGSHVLHLKYMKTIGVRELQQHASAALRRVERGETIGVTDRGRLVAVLSAPSAATGAAALVASSRFTGARRQPRDLPEPVRVARSTAEVLDELRAEG